MTSALIAVIASQGAAQAQSSVAKNPAATPAPASNTGEGQEIVVTAQRREQNLQKTPIAVTAFNQAMLQNRAINEVTDIAASTPGLLLTQGTASPSTVQIAMRGALEQNGGSITSESPVAIYIDDVYQSRLGSANFDLADIERIEVLRGPQGTLYGRNSMTGAIKLVTRQPNGATWLNTDLSYASYDEVKGKISLGGPLASHLALAASGFYNKRNDGWQYDVTTHEHVGKFEHYGAQLALGLIHIDHLEATLTGSYVVSNSDGQHFVPISEAPGAGYKPSVPFYDTATPNPGLGNNTQQAVSLHLGYNFGAIKLRSITAYQTIKDQWALDFSGGEFLPDGSVIAGFYRHEYGGQNQITQEFQALGTAFDEKLHYIVGAFYFDEHAHQLLNDNLAAFGLTYLPETYHTYSRSLAFYGQADYEVLPGLTASVGIRHTDDHKTFAGLTQNGFVPALAAVSAQTNAKVWTPKFNLSYQATPHTLVYGTVSKGYRAGGFNSLVIADPTDLGKPYQPETVWSYEVGGKFDAFDHMLRTNASLYYEDLSNLQTLANAGSASFIIQNAAKATVEGVELESTLTPTRNFSLFGNVTYTYDKYGKLDPSTEAFQFHANRLPNLSRWQYQIGGTYSIPLPNDATVQIAGDYSYRSRYYSLVSLAPSSLDPPIGRANMSLTYKTPGDHYEIYGQVTNLADSKDDFAAAEFIPGVFGYKIPLEPREFRVGFRYKM